MGKSISHSYSPLPFWLSSLEGYRSRLGRGLVSGWPRTSRMNLNMNSTRRIGLLVLLLSSGLFIVWGSFIEHTSSGGMADFKAIYFGARCVIHHSDPYKEAEFLCVYRAEGGVIPFDPTVSMLFLRAVPVCINLPTALFIVAPFSFLGWGPAHVLWMFLTAACLMLSSFLAWTLAADWAPGVSLFLICIALANSEILFSGGNLAGIAVSLCVMAVWCFLKDRFVPAGALCLAVSLAFKPHDAGLVWLYFLLAGGVYRKRALHTLVVAVLLSVPAVLWVSHVAPNWMQELHSNLSATSGHGDLNDPGPASIAFHNVNMVVDLQSVVGVFRDDPRIYNPITYLVCGALLLMWSIRTVRSRFSQASAWFALAAVAPLSLLPVYHREYDAKLLLLTVPACAMLWAGGDTLRWLALLLNTAGIVLTGDIPAAILVLLTRNLHLNTGELIGQILTVVLIRPAPLVLLAMAIFYLWVYLRRAFYPPPSAERGGYGQEGPARVTA